MTATHWLDNLGNLNIILSEYISCTQYICNRIMHTTQFPYSATRLLLKKENFVLQKMKAFMLVRSDLKGLDSNLLTFSKSMKRNFML